MNNNKNNQNNIINNNMNNMINNNNMNNMVSNNNMNNFDNFIKNDNMHKMSYINNNNLNNNMINKNLNNNQTNDNFKIKYNVLFKTTNNIEYSLIVNGEIKMHELLKKYEVRMGVDDDVLQYFYCGNTIAIIRPSLIYELFCKNELISVYNFFKDNKNPVIIVKDDAKLISKLIQVTYHLDNGKKYSLFFNKLSKISNIKYNFCDEAGYYINDEINFIYNNCQIIFDSDLSVISKITIGEFFKNNEKPQIIVKDPYNLNGGKIQVTFQNNHGNVQKFYVDRRSKIGDIVEGYLQQINEIFIKKLLDIKLFNMFRKKVQFFYKGQEIKVYYDYKFLINEIYDIIIAKYFKDDINPTIFVNDPYNIFLINWYEKKHIIFQTNHGYKNEFVSDNTNLCSEIIDNYFKTIGHDYIYNRYKIQF